MSINGVLEDLPLADVLQFIHLGRRTGTLYMWQGEDRRAEIGFHDGRIVSAWKPDQRKLGDLLVSGGVLDLPALETALVFQKTDAKGKSIGQILIERNAVTQAQIYGVIQEQIQKTVFDLVNWRHGFFQFEVDELHPMDDFGLTPDELLENLDLNTQMLVLEATRLFDERHRDRVEQKVKEESESSVLEERLKRARLGTGGEEGNPAAVEDGNGHTRTAAMVLTAIRCQVVTNDQTMVRSLADALPEDRARVISVPLREAGTRLPGESTSPIVILDLRRPELGPSDVATLARTRPAAPVVVLVTSPQEEAPAYEAGALAVVMPGRGSVVDCCRNLIRVLTHPQPRGAFVTGLHSGFMRFRQVVFDVQSGLASATMALNLMHVISDSVERAILFLVQGDELVAVGAFGFSNDGTSLAEATRGFRLRPSEGSPMHRVVEESEPLILDFDDAALAPDFKGLVGRPVSGQVVLFPVLGAEHTISVIYTDNGSLREEIQDINILELATSQVGMAFENELLRQDVVIDSDDVNRAFEDTG